MLAGLSLKPTYSITGFQQKKVTILIVVTVWEQWCYGTSAYAMMPDQSTAPRFGNLSIQRKHVLHVGAWLKFWGTTNLVETTPLALHHFVLVFVDAVSGSLGVLIIWSKVIYISCQGDLDTRSLQ